MDIELKSIRIGDLVEGFENNEEEGVVGYNGLLNIRPKYQREFVYSEKQQQAVIHSIFSSFPLNVFYWVEHEDGTFDLLDGQQRTLSICSYYSGEFFIDLNGTLKAFHNLSTDQKNHFLNYELQVYICRNGSESERIKWFETINIAGERLMPQEIRNAIYSGSWVEAMKRKFSKSTCVAYKLGNQYMSGEPIRQAYFEKVISWIIGTNEKTAIEKYMGAHQHDKTADVEWQYFQNVINWIKTIFPKYRSNMKGLDWGNLYNEHKNKNALASELEQRIAKLMLDDDVTNKKGIYEYLLSGNESKLNIRAFTEAMKLAAYEAQNGIC
ncbi:MAG: DUF262 domain-containing protein, partial [Bacteroidaceae bacterium]|nr:DUF262 domain-containing protein [Bacteroidaceae bacterium]